MNSALRTLRDTLPRLLRLDRQVDEIKLNQGRILAELQTDRRHPSLADYEFKVFSQWGEDGILQHLTRHLAIRHRTFIEFGVEDFFESNCRFLLMKDLWHGFVIDGSPAHVERLKSSYFFWRYPLQAECAFVTRENVAELLQRSGFEPEVGILSIDVDGIDWHLLSALGHWRAAIVVVEYNALFGPQHAVSVPYSADFLRAKAHWSRLYWGASLGAFDALLAGRGYALVGVNGMGSNAFFVRRELLNERVPEVSIGECWREMAFRETRDAQGQLTYQPAHEAAHLIADLPLVDTRSGAALRVADVLGVRAPGRSGPP